MEDREQDIFEGYEVSQSFNIPTYENQENIKGKRDVEGKEDKEDKEDVKNIDDIKDIDDIKGLEGKADVIIGDIYRPEIQEESYKSSKDETALEAELSQSENDTSFNEYVRKNSKKPKNNILKWLMRIAKLGLFIMLLPLISLLAGIIGGGIVALLGGGVGLICLSIGTLIGAAFFLSFLNPDLIFLMLSLIITLAATGGLILLTGILCCKALVKGIKYYRMKKSRDVRDGEDKIA